MSRKGRCIEAGSRPAVNEAWVGAGPIAGGHEELFGVMETG